MDLDLQNIPAHYRPAPFWSWNDKLDPAELRRQIREMHDAGLGGFFMHARGGLQTPYLSDEWMDCIKTCIAEADKYGMQAWLYDENGWPSGFGGGAVNGLGVKYQQKYLRHEFLDASDAGAKEHTIAFYDAGTLTLLGTELPAGRSGRVLRCFYEINPYYVDNLDPAVVAEFIRVTHQRYYDTLPPQSRDRLCGVFTDEPQLSRNGLLWSFVLEKEYKKEYDRELLPELPGLFLETPDAPGIRVRFWSFCAKLFSLSYMKQIRDWCDAHHWKLTGHHVLEETFRRQISSNGAIIPQYRSYHIPGVDNLGRFAPSALAATQLASCAAQFGQKQLMTESFAATGWACHFSGMRWIYLQQMAHGINFLCPHLQGYSLRGARKRDYPASAFYHQPWWPDYRKFTESVSRVGMILAEGRSRTDCLVIHPISSAWKHFAGKENVKLLDDYNTALEKMTLALDERQISHHYADKVIVDSVGSVEKDRIRIGDALYRIVIIPQLSDLSRKIAEILMKFHQNGGRIIAVRNRCESTALTVDGEPASPELLQWFRALPSFETEIEAAQAVAETSDDLVRVTENGVCSTEIISTLRQVTVGGRSGTFYYFVNRSFDRFVSCRITLPESAGEVETLDPLSGLFSVRRDAVQKGNAITFSHTFAPASDACFFVTAKTSLPAAEIRDPLTASVLKKLDGTFTVKKHSGNILTIDHCQYRIDGGQWRSCAVIDLQSRLLALKRACRLDLQFEFFCDEDFDLTAPLRLAVETPERFHFALNGKPFELRQEGFLFDKAFHLIQLPPECRIGRNEITMSLEYTQPESVYQALEAAKKFEGEYNKLTLDTELESIYLYGDFSVRHHGTLESLPRDAVRCRGSFSLGASPTGKTVALTDLIAAGFPFFSGTITLERELFLTEDEVRNCRTLRCRLHGANSCKIKINAQDAGGCFWEPFEWPAAALLKAGKNTLSVELTTSLRNMLGPHHLAEGESYGVSPLSFHGEPDVIGRVPPPGDPGFCFVNFGVTAWELTAE